MRNLFCLLGFDNIKPMKYPYPTSILQLKLLQDEGNSWSTQFIVTGRF